MEPGWRGPAVTQSTPLGAGDWEVGSLRQPPRKRRGRGRRGSDTPSLLSPRSNMTAGESWLPPPITAAPTRKAPRGTGRCGHGPKAKSGHSHGPAGTLSEVYYTKVRTHETGFDLLFTVAEERFGSLPSLRAQCRAAGASRGLTAISPSTPSFLIFPNRHSTPTEHSRPSLLSPWHLPLCLHHSAW